MSKALAAQLLDTMRQVLDAEMVADATDAHVASVLGIPHQHVYRARKKGLSLKLARAWAAKWREAGLSRIRFVVGDDEESAQAWCPEPPDPLDTPAKRFYAQLESMTGEGPFGRAAAVPGDTRPDRIRYIAGALLPPLSEQRVHLLHGGATPTEEERAGVEALARVWCPELTTPE